MIPANGPPTAVAPNTFSSLLFINECLLDEERTSTLRTAIRQKVEPGDVVVDAGTGSGILALFAAEAGAAKVYAVDVDPAALTLARRAIGASAFADRIEVVQADLKEFELSAPADLVVMEMLDTGLIAELQAPALNALRRHGVIGPRTRVVPERVRCSVELVEYDFDFYGFTMPLLVQARNSGVQRRVRQPLSEPVVYREADFGGEIAITVDESVRLCVERTGTLNALRLRTQTVVCEGVAVWETSDMNMPVIVPVGSTPVQRGEEFTAAVHYLMGCGYANLRIQVSRLGESQTSNQALHLTRATSFSSGTVEAAGAAPAGELSLERGRASGALSRAIGE
jgi:predicted RNA methylase